MLGEKISKKNLVKKYPKKSWKKIANKHLVKKSNKMLEKNIQQNVGKNKYTTKRL